MNLKKISASFFQILLATLVLFLMLEGVFRFVGTPGARRFVEKVVVREKLTRWKPKDEVRIFAFGESTMHGAQYGPASNPARWLEAYLKDFLPGKKIRVVNFSRLGGSSEFALSAFKNTVYYKPDIAIFYKGHNLFLPKCHKRDVLAEKSTLGFRFNRLLRQSYFIASMMRWGTAVQMRLTKDRPDEDQMGTHSIETSLPTGIPLKAFRRDDPYYQENIEYFKGNILKIGELAALKKIHVLFFKPVSNLKDFPPGESYHKKNLTPENHARWESAYQEGRYLEAYRIDREYAELAFRLGEVYFKKGDYPRAKRFFRAARDWDALVIRAPKEIPAFLEELRKERGWVVVDTEKVLTPKVQGGILGSPVVEDNVHLSIEGHSLVGRLAAEEIADQNWIAPKKEWHFEAERPFDAIAQELGIDRAFLVEGHLKVAGYLGSRFEARGRAARRALHLDPENPRALRHLAWSYWMRGERGKAIPVYQKLKRVDPGALEGILDDQADIRSVFLQHRLSEDWISRGKGKLG